MAGYVVAYATFWARFSPSLKDFVNALLPYHTVDWKDSHIGISIACLIAASATLLFAIIFLICCYRKERVAALAPQGYGELEGRFPRI